MRSNDTEISKQAASKFVLEWLKHGDDDAEEGGEHEYINQLRSQLQNSLGLYDNLSDAEKAHWLNQFNESSYVKKASDSLHNRSSHPVAKSILAKAVSSAQPFALFLRNVSLESIEQKIPKHHKYNPIQSPKSPFSVLTIRTPTRKVEDLIADVVTSKIPIVGLANQDNPMDVGKVPKLKVPLEKWKLIISNLIILAKFIVIVFQKQSEGIKFELDLIQKLDRKSETIIIIPSPEDDPFAELYGIETDPDERFIASHFRGWKIARQEDLEEGRVEIFASLLEG